MPSRPPVVVAVVLVIAAGACSTTPTASPTPPVNSASAATPSLSVAPSSTPPPTPSLVPTSTPSAGPGADRWVVPCQQELSTTAIESTMPAAAAITPRIALGDATTGALIAAAALPDDATELFLGLCMWTPADRDRPVTNAGTVASIPARGLALERVIRTQEAPIVHALGGRVTNDVASVVVTLADGSTRVAVLEDGYWLTSWTGPSGSTSIVARDAAGTAVKTVAFDDMAP